MPPSALKADNVVGTVRLPSPHAGQRIVFGSEKRFNVASMGRRWRKTSGAMAYVAIPAALQGKRVMWASPSHDQSRIAWDEATRALGNSGVGRPNKTENTIYFDKTRGRITFRSMDDPNTARGHTADVIIVDEAADVPEEAWYEVLRPMLLDTRGSAWIIGCVTGDTLVTTEDGLVPIASLSDNRTLREMIPLGKTVASNTSENQVASHFWYNGTTETRKIRTTAGYVIEATTNHPLWQMLPNGNPQWTPTSDLREGDYIALRPGADLWGTDDSGVDLDTAYLMGLILGDGHVDYEKSYRTTIACSPSESETREFLIGRGFKEHNDYHLRLNSKSFTQSLLDYGFEPGVKAPKKTLPSGFLRSPRAHVAAFLSGLFDADGSSHGKRGTVSFTTSSPEMARQLQVLLLNFGIVTRLRQGAVSPTKRVASSSYIYTLEFSPQDSRRFYERIGFRLSRKQCRQELIPDDGSPRHGRTLGVPFQGPRIGRVRKGAWFKGGSDGTRGNATKGIDSAEKAQFVGYRKLEEIIERCSRTTAGDDLAALRQLCAEGYFWDRVVSIDNGAAETFDVSVPATSAFIGNGFVNHNTPKGRNWFWREWVSAHDRDDSAAWQSPGLGVRIDPDTQELVREPHPLENTDLAFEAFKEDWATTPERAFRQEYLAEFLDDGGGVFRNVTERATGQIKDPYQGNFGIGGDLARINDFTVLTVIDLKTKSVVDWLRFNQVDWHTQQLRIHALYAKWTSFPGSTCQILIERNMAGDPIIEALRRLKLPVQGFQTTSKSKGPLIQDLVLAIERGHISYPNIPILVGELQAYEQERLPSGQIRYRAPEGLHDDCVMSLALAWKLAKRGNQASMSQDFRFVVNNGVSKATSLIGEYRRSLRAAREVMNG